MKKLLLIILALVFVVGLNAQNAYRTLASGNWNAPTTWERYNAATSSWSGATVGQTPTSIDSVFIQAGHTVTLTQNESCLNLAMSNATGVKLALNDFALNVNGTIGAFTNTVATFAFPLTYTATLNQTMTNGTNGQGVIRFVGGTRNIYNSGQWGANPAIWNCEFALNAGAIGTIPGSFKAGEITVASGTIVVNTDLRPDSGAANTGDLIIKAGATLRVNGSISRTGTLTNTIDSVDVFGALELAGTSATQNLSTVNFRVNNGGRVVKINNNALVATITNRTWATGSTLEYAGTANQTIGGEFPGTLPKVVINNTGAGAAVTFSGSRYITDSLVMTAGNISLSATDSLTLGVSNTGVLVYNAGTIIGKFNRFISATTTGNILYPVGTATAYRPVNANFVSAPLSSGNVSIVHSDNGVGNQTITSFIDGSYTVDRISQSYWAGSVNNGLLATNITLSCTLTGQSGTINSPINRIVGSRHNGATIGTPGGTHSAGSGTTAYRTGFQVMSPINFRVYLGGNSVTNPLPIQYKSITATRNAGNTVIKWATASESNNKGFEVQRSVNGGKYLPIAFVMGAGNSSVAKNYTYTDFDNNTGSVCYRLKQIDMNGVSELSKVVCVTIEAAKTNNELVTSPNPFNGSLHIKYSSINEGIVTIQVIDMLGKTHQQVTETVVKGDNQVTLNTDALPLGIYFVRIVNGNDVITHRAVKR